MVHAIRFLTAWLAIEMLVPVLAYSQAVSELPRAEYYIAKEIYGAGRTEDAAAAFEASLAVARRVGELRWVDSIPPLVMLGECYYQQGNLGLALEQYEAALGLALENPVWIDQIEVGLEQLAPLEATARGPSWFARSQPSTPVTVPEGLQIAIDPTEAQVIANGTIVAPVSLITRLDATEVLKTMGLALVRRQQILGPLTKHSQLAGPLDKLFSRNPLQPAPWVLSAWNVLRGISQMGSPTGIDSTALLRKGVTIQGRFDYFMSPLALWVLGQKDANEGKYQAAISNLQNAALLSALFEQHTLLSESLNSLSSCAAATNRSDLLEPLQQVAAWSSKNSLLAHQAALLGAAELSLYSGNIALAETLLGQSNIGLRGRGIALPRLQAQSAFVAALLNFSTDRGGPGLSNLNAALAIEKGTVATGPMLARVFQKQRVLDLYADGRLTARLTEELLDELLAEPADFQWRNEPLETLAILTTASLPAYERWLELAVGIRDDSEIVRRMDRLQRQQVFEALPLGGRLFCWRLAAQSDLQSLPADVRQTMQSAIQRLPQLAKAQQDIKGLVATLRNTPLPLDERQLTADAKKAYRQLDELSQSYENLLTRECLSRIPMDRFAPKAILLADTQNQLAAGEVILSLVATNQKVFGAVISRDQMIVWQVADVESLRGKLNGLLRSIGLVRTETGPVPFDVAAPDAAWRRLAAEIFQLLIPAAAEPMIAQSQRLIIAPHAQLWYVPYELLPEGGVADAQPWLARREITYVPTLGSTSLAAMPRQDIKSTVGLVGNFFAMDNESNALQADALVSSVPNSHKIVVAEKSTVPSASWLRLSTDRLWVADLLNTSSSAWDTVALPTGKTRPPTIATWLQTPQVNSAQMLLPGLETSMRSGTLQNGNDVLIPVVAMLFGGTRSGIISRWSVGGPSAQRFLLRCLQELESESSSSSARRAALALWTEDFLSADEPSLRPIRQSASAITNGQHPLLWSGYMSLGN